MSAAYLRCVITGTAVSLPPRALAILAALLLAWASGLCPTPVLAADTLSADRQQELLREGLNSFDEAVSIVRDDPAHAEKLYRTSAAAFQTLCDAGVRSAALEYNLGNAHFRLGEIGRAILHYRRALRLDPTDAALNANLEYARNRVEPYIKPSGGEQLVTRLMFWTNRVSMRGRFRLAMVASIAGWLGLIVWLRWRSRPLAVLAGLTILLGLANAASVGWQIHDESARPPAVVVDGEHILRLGRGEGYDPALSQPLGPGVELRILSERADWYEVRLHDGKAGWLPARAVGKV